MARFVLLEFDDDADADNFVGQVERDGGVYDDEGGGHMSYKCTVGGNYRKLFNIEGTEA
jgi:hypothetical protein